MTFDHLNAQELRTLLDHAVDLLSPAKRRLLMANMRPPTAPATARAFDIAAIEEAAAELAAYIEDHEEAIAAIVNDDWNPNGDVQENYWALEADLEQAIAESAVVLESAPVDEETAAAVAQALGAVADLHATDICGISYGEVAEVSAGAQVLELWQYLYANRTADPATLADGLVHRWPRGQGDPLLVGVLDEELSAWVVDALEALADSGDASAARWLIVQDLDCQQDWLARYAGLARDLGEMWARHLAACQRWPELEQAAATGVTVPGELLYSARIAQGRFVEAFTGAFPLPMGLTAEQLWDDAVSAGVLDILREVSVRSVDRMGRWLGAQEPELLELSTHYDHDAIKAVVSYAVARLSGGKHESPCGVYWLTHGLLARLATAPGPHDHARCVAVALAGYEKMIAFHIAGRSRNRYRRAAVYWAALRELAVAEGDPRRDDALRVRHSEDLRRLPALRSEMAAVL